MDTTALWFAAAMIALVFVALIGMKIYERRTRRQEHTTQLTTQHEAESIEAARRAKVKARLEQFNDI